MYAHASVAERIVLLFNSDRVIDLARLSCARTCMYAARHTRPWRKRRAKVFAGLGAWRGKVSFNDFDMGGGHDPPCNLHYSRDVSALTRHRRGFEWPMPRGRDSDLSEPIS